MLKCRAPGDARSPWLTLEFGRCGNCFPECRNHAVIDITRYLFTNHKIIALVFCHSQLDSSWNFIHPLEAVHPVFPTGTHETIDSVSH